MTVWTECNCVLDTVAAAFRQRLHVVNFQEIEPQRGSERRGIPTSFAFALCAAQNVCFDARIAQTDHGGNRHALRLTNAYRKRHGWLVQQFTHPPLELDRIGCGPKHFGHPVHTFASNSDNVISKAIRMGEDDGFITQFCRHIIKSAGLLPHPALDDGRSTRLPDITRLITDPAGVSPTRFGVWKARSARARSLSRPSGLAASSSKTLDIRSTSSFSQHGLTAARLEFIGNGGSGPRLPVGKFARLAHSRTQATRRRA